MRVFRSLDEIPRSPSAQSPGRTIVSIGNFDGVHCGHRWLLQLLKKRAVALSTPANPVYSIAVTFEPHPTRVLRPDDSPRMITPLESRLVLLAATGVDAVLLLPFTPELSRMSGEEFVSAILCDALQALEVHEGENFRFGHRAHGNAGDLVDLGRKLGFAVVVHPPRFVRGMMISSSKVRQAILAGDMARSRALLGRAFSVQSTPAPGRGIGSRLTVPTINLAPYEELLPADGVYITRLTVGADEHSDATQGRTFNAVTNAGKRPTFGADSYAVESYLLDYDPRGNHGNEPLELTAQTPLELTFLRRLRGEVRFPSPEALKAQIMRDVGRAKRYFHLARLLQTK